jgi:hypothetical protein
LESNHGVRKNQRYPPCHENDWTPKYPKYLLYTQLITFENDEFHSATAKTVQDAQKLVESGFEYVCDFSDTKLFRKPK